MKIEVTIDSSQGEMQVVDACCTGTLFRGFETLLVGRSPLDAPAITQRICGVCPISHGQAAVLALENVSEYLPLRNARLMRNLTLAANFLQSHILHFYLLAAMDFVPGPAKAPWDPAWPVDMRPGLDQVMGNLAAALEARRRAHEMGAILSGKMPATQAFVPGGFTATPSAVQIQAYRDHLRFLADFIQRRYIPDVEAIGRVYADYAKIGSGPGNLMAFGAFPMDDAYTTKLFRSGSLAAGAGGAAGAMDGSGITEAVSYSWYADASGNLPPERGETQPEFPKDQAYSWLKAPRLSGKPFEVGPLARMRINGDYSGGVSVFDRHRARAYEALKIAGAMPGWLDGLDLSQKAYDDRFDMHSGSGTGMSEAPRGALGHWLRVEEDKIAHYQVITPTCWNASPRDDGGMPGPMEQALIGTPIKDPQRPIEALRVVHSFDPCLSCAVHVMRPGGKPEVVFVP